MIVAPGEAQALLDESGETGEYLAPELIEASKRLARTVATEPDRTRAAAEQAWHEGWLAACAHMRAVDADPACPPHEPNPYASRMERPDD